MAAKIKKGDRVVVTTGRDKGKSGEVLRVMPKESRALVRGINVVVRHQRQTATQEGGIIRKEAEMEQALGRLAEFRGRIAKMTVEGHRQFNPGWHLALDLRNMLTVSECVAKAALQRQESRGGHTRDDYPAMSAEWRKKLLVCKLDADGGVDVSEEQQIPMREDLLELFEVDELKKYLTEEELPTA